MPVRISKNRVALENVPLNESKGADIASASTVNLDSATGNLVHITGTTTITAITLASGSERTVIFDAVLTLTHNSTTLILPGSANITTAAGDRAIFRGDGSGNTRCISYIKASGTAVVASSNKNVIIGGDFTTNPWQRGTSFTGLANGSYGPDRWKVDYSHDGVVDILKTTDAPTAAEAGDYATHCLHADVTTADATIAAGQYYLIRQFVEGLNTARFGFGQSGTRYITLSFWIKSTKTGTYCVSVQNSAGNRSYIAEYTVNASDIWEKKTVTIAVDNTGTWLYDTGIGIRLSWALACGSTYQTAAGSWTAGNYFASSNQVNALDSVTNNFKLALVQLEEGSSATAFEYRPIGQEITLCQRYYCKSFNINTTPANGSTASVVATNLGLHVTNVFRPNETVSADDSTADVGTASLVKLPVIMRTSPTVTLYGNSSGQWRIRDTSGATNAAWLSPTVTGIGHNSFVVNGSSYINVDVAAQMKGHWAASAEL